MSRIDPYLLVRAVSLYSAIVLLGVLCAIKRPHGRRLTGALLSMAWNGPALLALHVVAVNSGWWSFDAEGGLFMGMPIDLWLAWAILWGPAAALAFPSARLITVCAVALAIDVVLMPMASPVVRLGPDWLTGELVGIAFCLVPAQLLSRWTAEDRRLPGRALLQVIAFTALLMWLLPTIAIEASSTTWANPFERSTWIVSLLVQLLALPALLGLSAVQEFVTRGGGTPIPFDPPRRIVTTGPYAYVANPMQVSAIVVLLLLGVVLQNFWVAAAGVMAHIYSAGLAGWDEDADLRERFAGAWPAYRASVRKWIPRRRPWYRDAQPIATLYVSEECGMCSEVAAWFRRRGARGMAIVAAEDHPRGGLRRITYEANDGSYSASGTDAIARALEHVHVGWALAGFAIRMPIVSPLIQLIADASGAGPRPVRDRVSGAC